MKKYFFIAFFIALNPTSGNVFAQPANDLCQNAMVVPLGQGNFDCGIFTSSQVDITSATISGGEFFHSTLQGAGNDKKSVWFSFDLPTSRYVKVTLKQPGNNIPQNGAGFTVFRSATCGGLGNQQVVDAKLTPIAQFGGSFNPCLMPGHYLVQIGAKLNSNGQVFIEITTDSTTVLNEADFSVTAHDFGALSNTVTSFTFDAGCLSVDNNNGYDACSDPSNYTQSGWYVFKTAHYQGYYALRLTEGGQNVTDAVQLKVYRGNGLLQPPASLTEITACSFLATAAPGQYITNYYFCSLDTSTYHTIQLIYHQNFYKTAQLEIEAYGNYPTHGADPQQIEISNQIGNLPVSADGTDSYYSDYLSCNALMERHTCQTVQPQQVIFQSDTFHLATWYTFTLTEDAVLKIETSGESCCLEYLKKLYTGNVSTDCNLALYYASLSDTTLSCVPAGEYSLQILGQKNRFNSGSYYTSDFHHFGRPVNLHIFAQGYAALTNFDLHEAGKIDTVNYTNGIHEPLHSGAGVLANTAMFGCRNTVMPSPDSDTCPGVSTKAIYRLIKIDKSGTLQIISGAKVNESHWYRLYAGDANQLAVSQSAFEYPQTITGLTAACACKKLRTYYEDGLIVRESFPVCVSPGLYTLVTFGTAVDLNRTDRPSVLFQYPAFDLESTVRFDTVNYISPNHEPLPVAAPVYATGDFFSCQNTVRPAGSLACNNADTVKAMYRIVNIGQNGILTTFSGAPVCKGPYVYRLYKGHAAQLAQNQNVFSYPETINGLADQAGCQYLQIRSADCTPPYQIDFFKVCVTPGYYTAVTFGSEDLPGTKRGFDSPYFQFDTVPDYYTDPLNPYQFDAINADSTNVSYSSGQAWFTCFDNEADVGGITPCDGATKLIYRQFYLPVESRLQISQTGQRGLLSVFSGKVSEVGISGLLPYSDSINGSWSCFQSMETDVCALFQPGWYTIVAYGTGNTYDSPEYEEGNGGDIGFSNEVTITIFDLPTPKFNRPYKACNVNNGNALEWINAAAGNYQSTAHVYAFEKEYFSCNADTPFSAHPVDPCAIVNGNRNRVAYYVFSLSQESFIHIYNIPINMESRIYGFDVRTDSSLMQTKQPVQVCVSLNFEEKDIPHGGIEVCRMHPGVYTLVIFGGNENKGGSVQPIAYVDRVETSRFDFAAKSYDFGDIPPDSQEYLGKPGDNNPLNPSWAASSDFISCTTGAFPDDPALPLQKCGIGGYPTPGQPTVIYPADTIFAHFDTVTSPFLRRTLWYTFTITGSGNVTVSAYNRTPGNEAHITNLIYPFSIYLSDVDGNLPFQQISANGMVDSTITQGLTYITENHACANQNSVTFNIGSCEPYITRRYYIVVDNPASLRGTREIFANMLPATQLEMGIRFKQFPSITETFDLFNEACIIGNKKSALPDGTYLGDTAAFSCASRSVDDPPDYESCADGTLWYTFETDRHIQLWVNYDLPSDSLQFLTSDQELLVFRLQTGNSPSGLVRIPLKTGFQADTAWNIYCLTPGRYYLMFTGCSYDYQLVVPRIKIVTDAVPFDYITAANNISTAPLMPGTYSGQTGCLTCASHFQNDPVENAPRTIWYSFKMGVNGQILINYDLPANGITNLASPSEIMLFRQIFDNDTTPSGLYNIASSGVVSLKDTSWSAYCGFPGQYFLMVTGYSYPAHYIRPKIKILSVGGDVCRNPADILITAEGDYSASLILDCHTMGDDYGEEKLNPRLGCMLPDGAEVFDPATNMWNFKTTWMRISLNIPLKVDITLSLTEHTNVMPNDITFRAMLGTCGAMTPYLCTSDALTGTTLTCMPGNGMFYVQILSPRNAFGSIELNINTIQSTDQQCQPINLSSVVANFTYTGICVSDTFRFVNISTDGTDVQFDWDLGDGTFTSESNPVHVYQPVGKDTSYQANLKVTNLTNMASDSVNIQVKVYEPDPHLEDTVYSDCGFDTVTVFCTPFYRSYYWSNNDTAYYSLFQSSGQQWVNITDTMGCSASDTFFIVFPPPLIIDLHATSNSPVCAGDNLILNSGQIANAVYHWTGPGNFQSQQQSDTISNTSLANAGYYYISVFLNHCNSEPDTLTVVINPIPVSGLPPDTSVCAGQSVTFSATAGYESYLWNTGQTVHEITVNQAGEYIVVISHQNCSASDTVILQLLPVPSFLLEDASCCEGDTITFDIDIQADSIRWYDGSTGNSFETFSQGTVWAQAFLGQCSFTDSALATIFSLPFIQQVDTSVAGQIEILATGNEPLQYALNNSPFSSSSRFGNLETGNYLIRVRDVNGCISGLGPVYINDHKLIIPNFFTPNGDGIHDRWNIIGIWQYPDADIMVFTREGQMLAKYKGSDPGWDGIWNGKEMPSNTYWYVVILPGGKKYTGHVTIKR